MLCRLFFACLVSASLFAADPRTLPQTDAHATDRSRQPEIAIAVPPATRTQGTPWGLQEENVGARLAELVQIALQTDAPATPARLRFVERIDTDKLLSEQARGLAGDVSAVSSLRSGRLLHADWILRLRFRLEDYAHPRLEADVVDVFRADLLARVGVSLEESPGASWYLSPPDAVVARVAALAREALRKADEQSRASVDARRVAPLVFINLDGRERLAPLGGLLQDALRHPRPGLRVLGYETNAETRAESALFLTGLTDLDPAVWARVADAFIWGEFEEAKDHSGSINELPVRVRLHVWCDDSGPRTAAIEGRFGDLPGLASAAADAALALIGEARVGDPLAQRAAIALRLHEQASASSSALPDARLLNLALFFDPFCEPALTTARRLLSSNDVRVRTDPDLLALRRTLDLSPEKKPSAPGDPASAAAPPARASFSVGPPPLRPFNAVFDPPADQDAGALIAAAEAGPVMQAPWLTAAWRPLSRDRLLPPSAAKRLQPEHYPAPLALAGEALWLSARPSWGGPEKTGLPGLWRLKIRDDDSAPAELIADFPDVALIAGATDRVGRLWLSTRGTGLIALDPASRSIVRRIGPAQGLLASDNNIPFAGADALYVGNWREAEGPIVSVPFSGGVLSQVLPPPADFLPGLPPAARAAIASFPDQAGPAVKLPPTPSYVFEYKPRIPTPPPGMRPPHFLRPATAAKTTPGGRMCCVPTGLGDGYWVANLQTVAWAAGRRAIPLARWLQGEIVSLADDGRHLVVAVARYRSAESLGAVTPEPRPDEIALHLYDYREGVWRGRIASPPFFSLFAGDGHILTLPATRAVWSLADSASLRVSEAPPAPPPEAPPLNKTARRQADARQRAQDDLFSLLRQPAIDLSQVRALLDAGADAAPALRTAAYFKKWDAFDLLLPLVPEQPLNQTPKTEPGTSARPPLGLDLVHTLLKTGRADLARRVIDAGAKVDYQKYAGFDESLAWLAIRSGDADLVARLRLAGWPLGTNSGQHPLREAVAQKNLALLRYLLGVSSRDDINDTSGNGQTALFAAADLGWTEGVRTLLTAGADDFSCDSLTKRQLRDVAAPWPEVAILLNRRPGAADNQLEGARAVAAALQGNPQALAAVAATPAVIRYRDFWDWTVLHHAARHGRAGLVARLLAAGAPRDALTRYGESALCMAAFHGDTATVSALLDAGADPDRHAGRGWLPLHAAAQAGRPDLVRILLAARADPDPSVGENHSPALVLAAATADDEESLRLLVKAGAPLDATDAEGFGPLEASVISDSPAKIQFLLDQGARWLKPVGPDYHPMDAAAKRGLTASIRKLRELGLRSPRALSLAKDAATAAVLENDESEAGRLQRLNEKQWPMVLAETDPTRRRERVLALLAAGANPSHLSAKWGTPLDRVLFCNDPDLLRLLLARGGDPSIKSKGFVETGAGRMYRPRTALYGWFEAKFDRSVSPIFPADFEDLVLAYLPPLWPHENNPHARAEMLDWAERAELPRAAAWMRSRMTNASP